MTIVASGGRHADVATADVFSWSELPELLAAEDLFAGECAGPVSLRDPVARDAEEEEDDEDEDEDEDWEDDDDDWEDDDEEDEDEDEKEDEED